MEVPLIIIKLVAKNKFGFSTKAFNQLYTGRYDLEDLKNSILYGRLIKKERDETGLTHYKYIIIGPSKAGELIYSCGKIIRRDDIEYFIITFHEVH
ncbi:MAG: hypothetical protein ONB13_00370 [candidate division KSB1 bacterium]|nr:hypothetical protein [candidate division KSB1 bacterium]MDZ7400850.1 hypothetical protein [candidate division KSB1 bacterium]